MFKFHEGHSVSLRADFPALGLKAGEIGVVWATYATAPVSYEVTFRRSGDEFDMTVTESDLVAVDSETSHGAPRAVKRKVEAA